MKKYILSLIVIILLIINRNNYTNEGLFIFHFSVAFLISFSVIPFIVNLAYKFKILDIPSKRKIHSAPTPKLGGIAVFFGFIISFFLSPISSPEIVNIAIASSVILAIGVLDDIYPLSAAMRLMVQIICVSFLIFSGTYLTIFPINSFIGNFFNAVFTFLWIIGITNAFNFLDGMNGEASGLGIIIGGTLSLYAYMNNNCLLGLVIISTVGATFGFFPYNFQSKADIFLGDGGSNFLGFFLSTMAISIEWGNQPYLVNILLPIMVFFICIYDTTMTTLTRIYHGEVKNLTEWIKYTAKDHIHHRFSILFNSNKLLAVMAIYFLAAHSAMFVILYSYYRSSSYFAVKLVRLAVIQTLVVYSFITWVFFKIKKDPQKNLLEKNIYNKKICKQKWKKKEKKVEENIYQEKQD